MTFRKREAEPLSFMREHTDVVSEERLDPVCFEPFEPEDVMTFYMTKTYLNFKFTYIYTWCYNIDCVGLFYCAGNSNLDGR